MSRAARTIATVQQARHRIFGTFYNPTNERTGRKVLKKKLIGPELADMAQAQSLATPRHQHQHSLWHFLAIGGEREMLADIADSQIMALNERERAGKLPPKKGAGKRASRKK
mmetsp:Transcript_20186/g.52065  ORF Transcript_20186/g.52065 Transcript_20186/m.52065 type:complete len:112 (+) Transcript_20186:147-482(+)